MDSNVNIAEYKQLLNKIKQRVMLAQKRAIFSASAEMLHVLGHWRNALHQTKRGRVGNKIS